MGCPPDYRTWRLVRHCWRRSSGWRPSRRIAVSASPGTRKLLELGYTPAGVRVPVDTALFQVPLFVRERESVVARLAQHELTLDYISDPPFDLYAPALAEGLPSTPAARIWSRDVLPVDPLGADRFLALLREWPGLCVPAGEEIRSGAGHDDGGRGIAQ